MITNKREKLIALLDNFMKPGKANTLGEFADYLISNGVGFVSFAGRHCIDLTGVRFGRLVVLERNMEDINQKQAMWLCQCDCGRQVTVRGQSLRIGKTRSCGCLVEEVRNRPAVYKTRLYQEWTKMKAICNNPNNARYKNYGGKGVKVCDEWKSDFKAFYDWAMANGYDETAPRFLRSVQRIDKDGNYCPENCYFPILPNLHEEANKE